MNKKPWESKTLWFFVLYALVSVAGLLGFADWTPSGDEAEIVGVLVAVVGIVLRFWTNRGVSLTG